MPSSTLDGADLAVRFLTGHGVPPDRTAIVWDAIALRASAWGGRT
ncbi:hypothetical protein ACGFXC_33640 [Streptomyces sp. NPDC048507]